MGDQNKRRFAVPLAFLAFSLLYIAVALSLLRQWGSPHPWARLDLYVAIFFVVSLLMAAQQIVVAQAIPGSLLKEFYGQTFDPRMALGNALLALGELSVFADYGHWRLLPALHHAFLQTLGLAAYLLAEIWLLWVDGYLLRNFAQATIRRQLLTTGPFRLVRHPRYAGLLLTRVGFSLIFASPLAWLFALGWWWLVLRRIRLEETHLADNFGDAYRAYAQGRPRLFPGIY